MSARTTYIARKVPEITAMFWVTKLLTTAMGEATSDFLANRFNPYLAVAFGAVVLCIGLALQFRAKRYIPWVYWFTVAMVAVFGTMAADVLHKQFGVPYWLSTSFFALALAAVFAVWYKVEGTLSIHAITSARREVFYWLTVMATFALGTAAGDWTATSVGLGYLSSAILFIALMAIPVVGRRVRLNGVFTFWFAYIVTRPIGASFADWFGKPKSAGLGYGDGTVSIVLTLLIIGCVGYMTFDGLERRRKRLKS